VRESGFLVPDIECIVVQPDIGLDGNTANRQGTVEGYISPVVIVRMNSFLGRICASEEGEATPSTVVPILKSWGRLTGIIPLVRSVGYVYPSLLWVLARIFCRPVGMSRRSAVTDVGRGAALSWVTRENATATSEEKIMADEGDSGGVRIVVAEIGRGETSVSRLLDACSIRALPLYGMRWSTFLGVMPAV